MIMTNTAVCENEINKVVECRYGMTISNFMALIEAVQQWKCVDIRQIKAKTDKSHYKRAFLHYADIRLPIDNVHINQSFINADT